MAPPVKRDDKCNDVTKYTRWWRVTSTGRFFMVGRVQLLCVT